MNNNNNPLVKLFELFLIPIERWIVILVCLVFYKRVGIVIKVVRKVRLESLVFSRKSRTFAGSNFLEWLLEETSSSRGPASTT